MKKSSIIISLAALVVVGGGAFAFAYHKKSVPAPLPVAVVQPVQQSPTVVENAPISVPTLQPSVTVVKTPPSVPKSQPTVKAVATATVEPAPVIQPTPQLVAVATPPVVAPAPEATSMTQVLNLSTSTDHKESDPFTMQGTKWRIDYSCSFTDNTDPYSLFNADIKSTDGSIDKNFADLVTDCPTSNSGTGQHSITLTNQIPGDYYLDVGLNDNITYSITVWDFR